MREQERQENVYEQEFLLASNNSNNDEERSEEELLNAHPLASESEGNGGTSSQSKWEGHARATQ